MFFAPPSDWAVRSKIFLLTGPKPRWQPETTLIRGGHFSYLFFATSMIAQCLWSYESHHGQRAAFLSSLFREHLQDPSQFSVQFFTGSNSVYRTFLQDERQRC